MVMIMIMMDDLDHEDMKLTGAINSNCVSSQNTSLSHHRAVKVCSSNVNFAKGADINFNLNLFTTTI